MRGFGPDLGLLVVGFALGAAGARMASTDPPPPAPARTTAEHVPVRVPEPPRAAPVDPERVELREEVRALEAEGRRIGALPAPWPEDAPPHLRPDAVRADMDRLVAERPQDFEGAQWIVDCGEYPCLVIYDHDETVEVPPPPFRRGYGLHSAGRHGVWREIYSPLDAEGTERRLDVRIQRLLADEP